MEKSADLIQWGEQIWNTAPGGRQTSTQMGSGHFSKANNKAAIFNECNFFLLDRTFVPDNFSTKATKLSCCDISDLYSVVNGSGVGFFYGGPGCHGCDEWNYSLWIAVAWAHFK